ncbi:hypothetical protein [Leuconostoc gasicomitatum]|uniref:hypothetical protein n=1 Tax=Leuconostoc gasicomitatum TaxID=115778 RepID=UPI0007E19FAE|nr:hypothetical protein [Leuconostoc gasicomitatum]CUW11286.1 hypothetical protein PB1E_1804 [Leuconostoc gasicomitatum]
MKWPHPLKQARINREMMKQEARQRLKDFDQNHKIQPVSNHLIWFIVIGFGFILLMKLVQRLIGG